MTVLPDKEDERLAAAAGWSLRRADRLSGDEGAQLEAWLAADAGHGDLLAGVESVLQDIDSHAGAPEMVRLRSQALATARRAHELRQARSFLGSRIGRAACAAVLVLALGAVAYWAHLHTRGFETAIGERRTVALDDGSQLILDADTDVDLKYTGEQRRLSLNRGRARFEVAQDALRPFAVDIAGHVVVALGTAFTVERVEDEAQVMLFEGRVEVLPSRTLLTPGQALILKPDAAPQRVDFDVQRAQAWETGILAFADEPLPRVLARINRHARTPVQAGDPAAAQVRISGVFTAGDIPAFVEGVTRLFPLRAETHPRAVVLRSRPADSPR